MALVSKLIDVTQRDIDASATAQRWISGKTTLFEVEGIWSGYRQFPDENRDFIRSRVVSCDSVITKFASGTVLAETPQCVRVEFKDGGRLERRLKPSSRFVFTSPSGVRGWIGKGCKTKWGFPLLLPERVVSQTRVQESDLGVFEEFALCQKWQPLKTRVKI